MIRFLQPEWFWALTALPLVMLWRGRRGPVAALEYSDVSLARDVARRTRSWIGGMVWLLPIVAAALMIYGSTLAGLVRLSSSPGAGRFRRQLLSL